MGDLPLGLQGMRFGALISALAVSACGLSEDVTRATRSSTNCVPLPEGQYTFQNGVFTPDRNIITALPAPVLEASPPDVTVAASPDVSEDAGASEWADAIAADFSEMGYDWLGLTIRGRSAILTGVASDAAIKEAAFIAGRSSILRAASVDEPIDIVIDAIAVEGGETGVGAALLALSETPSLDACQAAFMATLDVQDVEFRTGSAVIQPESYRLLDGLAGVSALCRAYEIEIGAHTHNIGEDLENMRLSQRRAEAVASALSERGTPDGILSAVGYGETRPLDESGTREANARNQRVEFSVRRSPRPR
ncbi:MAG: OmpA family protein [Pseudomonadota bacterium]